MSQTTSQSVHEVPASLRSRLRRLRGRVLLWLLVDGLSRLLLALVALAAVDFLIDWVFEMDTAQRAVVLALALVGLVLGAYRWLVRPLSRRLSDDALCLSVEQHYRELGESLISSLQFARMGEVDHRRISPAMVQATIERGIEKAEEVNFSAVLRSGRFATNVALMLIALCVIAAAGAATAGSGPLGIWFSRNVLLADTMWPQDTYFLVAGLEEDTLKIPRGDAWPLVVTIREDSLIVPDDVSVELRTLGDSRTELLEKRTTGPGFHTLLAPARVPFEFRLRAGGAHSSWYRAVLVDRPEVRELTLTLTSPKYAGGRRETLPPGRGPYYVLPGSQLRLRGTASKPLSGAALIVGEHRQPLSLSGTTEFETNLPPDQLKPGTYEIEVIDTERVFQPGLGQPGIQQPGPLRSKRATRFTLRTRRDREPRVNVRLQGIGSMVVPGARIPLACRVGDDFSVTAVRLRYRWRTDASDAAGQSGSLPIEGLAQKLGGRELEFEHVMELPELEIPAGAGLSFHVEADDNDDISGPKTGRSTALLVRVVSEDELRADLLRREKEQRQDLQRLISDQDKLLTDCQALQAETRTQPALDAERRAVLMRFQKRQKLMGTQVSTVAERLRTIVEEIRNNRLEDEAGPLQVRLDQQIITPLETLAGESIPQAARRLDETRRLAAEAEPRSTALDAAIAQQQEILAAMRSILSQMVKSEGFQEAVNLLYEIQRSQQDVLDLTNKKRQERINELLRKTNPDLKPSPDAKQGKPPEPEKEE